MHNSMQRQKTKAKKASGQFPDFWYGGYTNAVTMKEKIRGGCRRSTGFCFRNSRTGGAGGIAPC